MLAQHAQSSRLKDGFESLSLTSAVQEVHAGRGPPPTAAASDGNRAAELKACCCWEADHFRGSLNGPRSLKTAWFFHLRFSLTLKMTLLAAGCRVQAVEMMELELKSSVNRLSVFSYGVELSGLSQELKHSLLK